MQDHVSLEAVAALRKLRTSMIKMHALGGALMLSNVELMLWLQKNLHGQSAEKLAELNAMTTRYLEKSRHFMDELNELAKDSPVE